MLRVKAGVGGAGPTLKVQLETGYRSGDAYTYLCQGLSCVFYLIAFRPHTLKPCLLVHSTGIWISSDENAAPLLTFLSGKERGSANVLLWGLSCGTGGEALGCYLPPMGGRCLHKHAFSEGAYKIAFSGS